MKEAKNSKKSSKVRFAVVGVGYFAQAAVLPAFKNAKKEAELVALISGDEAKRKKVGRQYKVKHSLPYESYDEFLRSGEIDAVYLALPNDQHYDYAKRAIEAGVHILCEKPFCVTAEEARELTELAREKNIQLMVAYRLHFEPANLECIRLIQKGQIGEPKYYNALFSMQVREGNIRTGPSEIGGGPLYDIGIYCINASRYLFQAEPLEVTAFSETSKDPRFERTEETISAVLRFPNHRLASFTCSFGAADAGYFTVVGSKGSLELKDAFEWQSGKTLEIKKGEKPKQIKFKKTDQLAGELIAFSKALQKGDAIEPSGEEGYADLKVIEAIYESLSTKRSVSLEKVEEDLSASHPDPEQEQDRAASSEREPDLVHVETPSMQ